MDGNQIGRITILDRKSFIGMSREDADRVLATVDRLEIRG
ncbi:MAG: DbpA RNA binding domain-containing protein, partial [Deltaproteobacteria bacterium]|nr:DbpA RNA binding domain-containing protein [Deltaproteobacteria bacterium]